MIADLTRMSASLAQIIANYLLQQNPGGVGRLIQDWTDSALADGCVMLGTRGEEKKTTHQQLLNGTYAAVP